MGSNYRAFWNVPVRLNVRFVHCLKVNSDPRGMWKGIQTTTDHKLSIQSLPTSNAFLPNKLNQRAHFDKGVIHHTRNADSSTVVHPISLSTLEATVPTCLKTTTIIPVPKHSSAECLNDFHHGALTPIVMKCFEKLVLSHLIACLPPTLDPHQFAYCSNRSTEYAISIAIHRALTHLDNNNTYIQMLFIDFSSAFSTVILSKLIAKLSDLGICTSLCSCIMDFLTNRPQSVRLGNNISSTLILNTGVTQGCVLSLLLYSLFAHDCVLRHNSNSFVKYADDTTDG
ncbi:hypothetical protein QTP86_007544 [Hemibagrus guttatus]|nr:hypothetical protein QTP86_007544 [Hemibagrus guttatus]